MAFPNYQGGYYPQNYYAPGGAVPDLLGQYKSPYPQMQPQPQPQMPPSQTLQTNDMLWVLGEVDAMSYPVAPNNTVVLWDKDRPTVFIKSANAQGVPSIKILDYTERTENAPKTPENHVCKCGGEFVKIDEFKAVKEKLDALSARVEAIGANYAKEENK